MAAEIGRCDPETCWPGYVTDSGGFWQFAGCNQINLNRGGGGIIPNSIPIKTQIKGLSVAPFVKLRFEDQFGCQASKSNSLGTPPSCWDYTEITTGNISQPGGIDCGTIQNPDLGCKCRASIKSFQYSWGTVSAGTSCKITIVDEKGSDIANWFARIFKNPSADQILDPTGVYKMKVFFGWIVAGEDGDCPADLNASGTTVGQIIEQGSYPYNLINTIPVNNSTTPTRLISSPPLWFLPNNLDVSYQGNKIIFEITGTDLMLRASEQPMNRSYGTSENKIHFVDAVQRLCADAMPPMRIDTDPNSPSFSFKQIDSNGDVVNMKFHVFNKTATSSVPSGGSVSPPPPSSIPNFDSLRDLGPLSWWNTNQMSPLQVLRQWMDSQGVLAEDTSNANGTGVGITINFDPTNRQLTFWKDSNPSGRRLVDIKERLKAVYIVGGGSCSPVLSFTPTAKYNFQIAAQSGGATNTTTNRVVPTSEAGNILGNGTPGRGPVQQSATSDGAASVHGKESVNVTNVSTAANRQANLMHTTVEAELRVQGDPSPFLCGPFFGYGRSVGIIVINPFYLNREVGDDCPVWDQLSTSSCNKTFTSPSWFLRGVDHQVKDGSFVTTLKVSLFAPNAELTSQDLTATSDVTVLGGDVNVLATVADIAGGTLVTCNQGTYPCTTDNFNDWAGGLLKQDPFNFGGGYANRDTGRGTHIFCSSECTSNPGVG